MINNLGPIAAFKEVMTRSVYPPPDIKTIDQAQKAKEKNQFARRADNKNISLTEKILSKIKWGHVLGFGPIVSWVASTVFKDRISPILNSLLKQFSFVGLVPGLAALFASFFYKNAEEHDIMSRLDSYVRRYEVKADGEVKNISENTTMSEAHPTLNDVVLPALSEDEIHNAIDNFLDKQEGSAIALTGITGCGKTMTAQALARELASRSSTGTAQYWFAQDEAVNTSFMDSVRGPLALLKPLLEQVLKVESTPQKLERMISQAMLEKDNVVICLDEAHKFLGFTGRDIQNFNSSDPNQSSDLIESLKRLMNRLKECKNVMLVFTANSTQKIMPEPLIRRFTVNSFYSRPKAEEREKMIRITLKKLLEKKQLEKLKFEDFNEKDFEELSAIGTMNLFKTFGETDELARAEASTAGFGGSIEKLKSVNLPNYQDCETATAIAVREVEKNGGNKEDFKKAFQKQMDNKINSYLERSTWQEEFKYYHGEHSPKDSSLPYGRISSKLLNRLH